MAAEFDISKYSTRHDSHDDNIWVDHSKAKRRMWGIINGEKSDECGKIEYDSDANVTPIRRKHHERIGRNSRIIDLAVLNESSCELL